MKSELTIHISLSEPLLKKRSNGIRDTLKVFVAFLLGGLETAGNVPLDEGHRNCV